jgi:hypothetical protein
MRVTGRHHAGETTLLRARAWAFDAGRVGRSRYARLGWSEYTAHRLFLFSTGRSPKHIHTTKVNTDATVPGSSRSRRSASRLARGRSTSTAQQYRPQAGPRCRRTSDSAATGPVAVESIRPLQGHSSATLVGHGYVLARTGLPVGSRAQVRLLHSGMAFDDSAKFCSRDASLGQPRVP